MKEQGRITYRELLKQFFDHLYLGRITVVMEGYSICWFAVQMCGLFGGFLPPRRLPGWFQELRPQLLDVILFYLSIGIGSIQYGKSFLQQYDLGSLYLRIWAQSKSCGFTRLIIGGFEPGLNFCGFTNKLYFLFKIATDI